MGAADELGAGLVAALAERTLADGALCGRAGEPARADATAWGVVAWRLADSETERALRAGWALAAAQGPDGRLSSAPMHPGSSWPTAAAVLAWTGWSVFAVPHRRALDHLLATRGQTMPNDPGSPIATDSSIAGWPWVERTFSWVGPTALALLALEASGEGGHARAEEGRRLLLDRQLPSGGWNYGNTLVFGSELLPAPEETGPALAALAGRVERERVARSLGYLARELERVRTPQTLAWGVLALAAWGERPADADARLAESLGRAGRFGGYDSADLAVLLAAHRAPDGLVAALRSAA